MSSDADRPTRDRRSSLAHRSGSRDARSPSRACSCGRYVPARPCRHKRAPGADETRTIKKPAVAAAVACPEARHADQPLDLSLLHCSDEHPCCFGEESRRLEDDFGPDRNAERLDDDIDSSQRGAEFRASLEAESRKAAYAQGKQARTAE